MLELSVLIPTHNPDAQRLRKTFAGLKAQTLHAEMWEVVFIDNASTDPILPETFNDDAPIGLRLVGEPQLGLTAARRRRSKPVRHCWFLSTMTTYRTDSLNTSSRIFAGHPEVGAMSKKACPTSSGTCQLEFHEFLPLLALRDMGCKPGVPRGLRPDGSELNEYPVAAAPIGAGMAIRREAAQQWLNTVKDSAISDQRGGELSSGGDNDIVFSIMEQGWESYPRARTHAYHPPQDVLTSTIWPA